MDKLVELIEDACFVDGGHDKQLYLIQMAKILHAEGMLTINIEDIENGI